MTRESTFINADHNTLSNYRRKVRSHRLAAAANGLGMIRQNADRCEEITHRRGLFENCVEASFPGSLAEALARRARAMGGTLSMAVIGG